MWSAQLALVLLVTLAAAPGPDVPMEYQRRVLSNGLTVIVHEDHKAPLVAVNVWYHTGSKDEKPGRTGFAHLYEHLMFGGSRHHRQDHSKTLEEMGATDLNATTGEDRTNYFQTVPAGALDSVLWLESDRMGHLIEAVDTPRLEQQRGVVLNEKRQGDNQPYGLVYSVLPRYAYPPGHPYSWPVVGSEADLKAATLDDVREWAESYYRPTNATLVIAGDVTAEHAFARAEHFFGAIAPGRPLIREKENIARRTGSRTVVLEDRVPAARLVRVWNVPPVFSREVEELGLVARLLGRGRSSWLQQRLVYRDQLAAEVSVFVERRELGSQFIVEATALPGVTAAQLARAVDPEIRRFLAEGPAIEELNREKTVYYSSFVRGLERIGGFGGKSDLLAAAQVYAGDPAAWRRPLEIVTAATAESLRRTAVEWLSDGALSLEVRPFGDPRAAPVDASRNAMPEPSVVAGAALPRFQRARLSNGLEVLLNERHETPVVNFSLLLEGGWAAERSHQAGLSRMTLRVLRHGTTTRDNQRIGRELDALGAQFSTSTMLEHMTLGLSALRPHLDASLALYADLILNPAFRPDDLERERKATLAAIQQETADPNWIGMRLLPPLLFGNRHPFAKPFTGTGTVEGVRKLRPQDLAGFHRDWFKPDHARLIVVGDTTLREVLPLLERHLGAWKPGAVPRAENPRMQTQPASAVYLIDRPDASQSMILAGRLAPPANAPGEVALETLNTLFGGAFTSRLNLNLRETRHWSYGAGSYFSTGHRGPRPFMIYAPVETEKTAESIAEIQREIAEVVSNRPPTSEEITAAQNAQIRGLPGSRETRYSVIGSMIDVLAGGLPEDFWDTYVPQVRALRRDDLRAAAERLLLPNQWIWVIVGDRARIEPALRGLNLGPVTLLEEDGRVVN